MREMRERRERRERREEREIPQSFDTKMQLIDFGKMCRHVCRWTMCVYLWQHMCAGCCQCVREVYVSLPMCARGGHHGRSERWCGVGVP